MLSSSYINYIYQVKGELIKPKPDNFFEPAEVYLIIDKNLNLIWIWAGSKSRLFHRYIASIWAGKLKSKEKYYNFKYEVIKQGREPDEFIVIFDEINEGRIDLKYPGESRTLSVKSKKLSSRQKTQRIQTSSISNSEKSQIKKILSEINEMQMHIKYSMEHIGLRIVKIEKILEK